MPADQQQGGGGGDNRPLRIPLATSIMARGESPSIDGRLVNAYAERIGQEEAWIYKRPGLTTYFNLGTTATGLGVFNWRGDLYSIWGTAIYKNGALLAGSIDSSGGPYTFSSILGATPTLFFHNTTHAYRYNGSIGVQSVAGGIPATLVPGQAYLDATTYVVTPGAVVQGSGLNDVSTWPALNNLIAQIEPDGAVACAKQLVYVVVFKQWTTEMFYDAANATGSPLGPVQGQKLNLGCAHAGTVAEIQGMLLWVSQVRNGGRSVMLMDQLAAQAVSTESVERILQAADFTMPVYSWTGKLDGHLFYGLTITASNITLVYDLKQKLWYEWADSNGNFFPIVSSTYVGGLPLFQHQTNGKLYILDATKGTDESTTFTTDVFTPPFEGGTRKRKVIGRMRLVGDKTPGNVLQVRVSDDDYKTFSNFRQVDMNTNDPYLGSCGTFRRRVWHIRQSTPTGGRILMALEPEMEVGDS